MPATYDSISTSTLGSGQSTITFSNIPQTYTDLVLIFYGRTSTQNVVDAAWRANGDSANNYSGTRFLADSSNTVYTDRSSNTNSGNVVQYGISQSVAVFHWLNYSNTTTYKTCIIKSQATISNTNLTNCMGSTTWRSTSAITSLDIFIPFGQSGNFVAGSVLSLYGIKAA